GPHRLGFDGAFSRVEQPFIDCFTSKRRRREIRHPQRRRGEWREHHGNSRHRRCDKPAPHKHPAHAKEPNDIPNQRHAHPPAVYDHVSSIRIMLKYVLYILVTRRSRYTISVCKESRTLVRVRKGFGHAGFTKSLCKRAARAA